MATKRATVDRRAIAKKISEIPSKSFRRRIEGFTDVTESLLPFSTALDGQTSFRVQSCLGDQQTFDKEKNK